MAVEASRPTAVSGTTGSVTYRESEGGSLPRRKKDKSYGSRVVQRGRDFLVLPECPKPETKCRQDSPSAHSNVREATLLEPPRPVQAHPSKRD